MQKTIESTLIIESPMQLLSGLSVCEGTDNIDKLVFLHTKDIKNNQQVCDILEQLKHARTVQVRRGFARVQGLFWLSISLIFNKVDRVLIGDYRSFILRFLANVSRAKSKGVVDDGIALWPIYETHVKNERAYIPNFSGIKGVLARTLALLVPATSYQIYTKLPLSGDRVFSYDYSFDYLKNKSFRGAAEDFDTLIVGSPWADCHIMQEATYLSFIKKISGKEIGLGNKVAYIPHRRESEEFLRKIAEFEICVIPLSIPLELYVLYSDRDFNVIAFSSAVLFNLASMNTGSRIASVRVPSMDINVDNRSTIDAAYDLILKACDQYEF